MSHHDTFVPGAWNAICDSCGRKFKSFELTRRWDGLMVCSRDWEPRHPQDFVRGRSKPDPEALPWSRPQPEPVFILNSVCTPDGRTAIPGLAMPGCALPGYIDPSNTQGIVL